MDLGSVHALCSWTTARRRLGLVTRTLADYIMWLLRPRRRSSNEWSIIAPPPPPPQQTSSGTHLGSLLGRTFLACATLHVCGARNAGRRHQYGFATLNIRSCASLLCCSIVVMSSMVQCPILVDGCVVGRRLANSCCNHRLVCQLLSLGDTQAS